MQTIDAIAEILKREGVQYLSCFPTTPVIEACAAAGIRPVICRQERVGVGIADGYSRVTNGRPPGVFAMQYGPGAENAYSGVATSFSDSVPILLLPLGHPRERQGVFPMFDSIESFASVTKHLERLNLSGSTSQVMRRAVNALYTGRPGPSMIEIPADVALEEVSEEAFYWGGNVRRSASQADPNDVEAAARALCSATYPVIHAGQGVMYAEATDELVELAELLSAPVMTTLLGKSGFPEHHPLALGSGSGVMSGTVYHFVRRADVIFGVGSSFTKHGMSMNLPAGRTLIQNTNDPRDLNKDYDVQFPVIGDAKLALRQMIEACREIIGSTGRDNAEVAGEIDLRSQRLAGRMAAQDRRRRPAGQPLPRHHRLPAGRTLRRSHHHPRLGQPPRPDYSLLPRRRPAQLPGLGKIPRPRHRTGPGHRRQAGRAGQDVRQLHGRRRLWHGRAGL